MNFRQATDALLESVTLEDLAHEMGVSVQALRQARTAQDSTAHRLPPQGWEFAASLIARNASERYAMLAQELGGHSGDSIKRKIKRPARARR